MEGVKEGKGREAVRKTSERLMGAQGDTVWLHWVALTEYSPAEMCCSKTELAKSQIRRLIRPVQSHSITHSGSEFVFTPKCHFLGRCVHLELESSGRRVQANVAVVRVRYAGNTGWRVGPQLTIILIIDDWLMNYFLNGVWSILCQKTVTNVPVSKSPWLCPVLSNQHQKMFSPQQHT